jgi:hypothetical protein
MKASTDSYRVSSLIGSKGPNLDWNKELDEKWKKAFLHRAITMNLKKTEFTKEFEKLMDLFKSKMIAS